MRLQMLLGSNGGPDEFDMAYRSLTVHNSSTNQGARRIGAMGVKRADWHLRESPTDSSSSPLRWESRTALGRRGRVRPIILIVSSPSAQNAHRSLPRARSLRLFRGTFSGDGSPLLWPPTRGDSPPACVLRH